MFSQKKYDQTVNIFYYFGIKLLGNKRTEILECFIDILMS